MTNQDPVFFLAVVPIVLSLNYFSFKGARRKFDDWIEQNHFQLLRATYVMLPMPWQPFWWRSREGYIFLIHILDHNGTARTGYAFCPIYSWLTGFSDKKVQAKWDS